MAAGSRGEDALVERRGGVFAASPHSSFSRSSLVMNVDVVDVPTETTRIGRLIIADIEAVDRLARQPIAEVDNDMVPAIECQMATLIGRMCPIAILIRRARITQIGFVAEDQVDRYARAIGARDRVDIRILAALWVDPIFQHGVCANMQVHAAEIEDFCIGIRRTGTLIAA